MLTYQLSAFSFSSDFVCDRCAFDHFDSTNLLQQNLLMSLRCEHLINKQTLQKTEVESRSKNWPGGMPCILGSLMGLPVYLFAMEPASRVSPPSVGCTDSL